MCIVALKYFPGTGWVGVKNRDRNYEPSILIRQSFRDGIERMYIWDERTRYAEGLNEFGVSILSASLTTKDDEKEGERGSRNLEFYSPDGLKIRKALLEPTVELALQSCLDQELPGNTIIFDQEKAYLLEASFNKYGEYKNNPYLVKKSEQIARTNHGILIPWSGYQYSKNDPKEARSRESSESRLNYTLKDLLTVEFPEDMMGSISGLEDGDLFLNPIRVDFSRKRTLRTTAQLMIIPKIKMLYFRPLFAKIEFDFRKLESTESKTFFQIVSAREIIIKIEKLKQNLNLK